MCRAVADGVAAGVTAVPLPAPALVEHDPPPSASGAADRPPPRHRSRHGPRRPAAPHHPIRSRLITKNHRNTGTSTTARQTAPSLAAARPSGPRRRGGENRGGGGSLRPRRRPRPHPPAGDQRRDRIARARREHVRRRRQRPHRLVHVGGHRFGHLRRRGGFARPHPSEVVVDPPLQPRGPQRVPVDRHRVPRPPVAAQRSLHAVHPRRGDRLRVALREPPKPRRRRPHAPPPARSPPPPAASAAAGGRSPARQAPAGGTRSG